MIYKIYKLREPNGNPHELLLKTADRLECMKKVADLLKEGESAATIRVVTEQTEEKREPGHEAWRYYY